MELLEAIPAPPEQKVGGSNPLGRTMLSISYLNPLKPPKKLNRSILLFVISEFLLN
jgi:hypothetical protein